MRWSKSVMNLMGCPHVCYKRAKKKQQALVQMWTQYCFKLWKRGGWVWKAPLDPPRLSCVRAKSFRTITFAVEKKNHIWIYFSEIKHSAVKQLKISALLRGSYSWNALCRLLRASSEEMIGLREKREKKVSFGNPICFCVFKVRCSIALW